MNPDTFDRDVAQERERLSTLFGEALDRVGEWRLVRRNGQRYGGIDTRTHRPLWTRGTGIDFQTQADAESFARELELKAKAVRVAA